MWQRYSKPSEVLSRISMPFYEKPMSCHKKAQQCSPGPTERILCHQHEEAIRQIGQIYLSKIWLSA